jgi:hypothetical protein
MFTSRPQRRPGVRPAATVGHHGDVPSEATEDPAAAPLPERVVVTPQMRERMLRSPRDITLSLLALLVPIAIALVVYRLIGGEAPSRVVTDEVFADARASRHFTVLEPALTSGWRPTTYNLANDGRTTTLRVTYTTPEGGALQLVETNAAATVVQQQELPGGFDPAGTAAVNGQVWQALRTPSGEHALVLDDGTRVVLIKGNADLAEMKAFAGLLR